MFFFVELSFYSLPDYFFLMDFKILYWFIDLKFNYVHKNLNLISEDFQLKWFDIWIDCDLIVIM